jgi:glycosyltransferase involved in cell wall biosynthesis
VTVVVQPRRRRRAAGSWPRRAGQDCPRDLAHLLEDRGSERAAAIARRIKQLLDALGSPVPAEDPPTLLATLEEYTRDLGPHEAWLALAVLTARLPDVPTVRRVVRSARLDGALPAIYVAMRDAGLPEATSWPQVEVVTGRVLVDVHHTARHLPNTGITRVVRETARRWMHDHDVIFVGWTDGYSSYRRLLPAEVDGMLAGKENPVPPSSPRSEPVFVPWKCTHVVPELLVEARTAPYQAVVMFSRSRTGLVGHDCVPLMASETTDSGLSVGFANFLAAAAHVDRMATVSDTSGLEFRGWRSMLAGAGLSGPDMHTVPLPVEATTPTDDALAQARLLLGIDSLPLVLSVGSHEPRKNHLALLHAAEVLWREGLLFNLVFVGGISWFGAAFNAQVDRLRRANRPVRAILALPDDLLWGAYRLAYCTVFASLHEGFGLPVAESLASGTPVITSDFGNMREQASHGGALLVDPRHDQSLTDALRRLLSDRPLRDRLAAEASQQSRRTWDDYAAELWDYLVEGRSLR